MIILSGILSFIPLETYCGSTETSCGIVHTSEYEHTLEIKNSYLGLGAFLILSLLTISNIKKPKKIKKQLIKTGLIIATGFAIYFMYIQFIILKATCFYCLIVDILTIISLGLLILFKEKRK